MAPLKYEPTRMCLSCRNRDAQINLQRLQCIDGNLSSYTGIGRSFYLCSSCLDDEKRLSKAVMRQCRSSDREKLMNKLKEILAK